MINNTLCKETIVLDIILITGEYDELVHEYCIHDQTNYFSLCLKAFDFLLSTNSILKCTLSQQMELVSCSQHHIFQFRQENISKNSLQQASYSDVP